MNIDGQKRYDSVSDFFELGGSVVMKLTADAAIACCITALARRVFISRIEGGIWHNPGFEARVDCIWDGVDAPMTSQVAEKNNAAAAEFIHSEKINHDVFIVTTMALPI